MVEASFGMDIFFVLFSAFLCEIELFYMKFLHDFCEIPAF
jgi:hypothetical protein